MANHSKMWWRISNKVVSPDREVELVYEDTILTIMAPAIYAHNGIKFWQDT